MMLGCEEVFEDSDVERFVDTPVFDKYLKFIKNIEVDMNPNRRWCPKVDCGRYINLTKRGKIAQCECGTNIC